MTWRFRKGRGETDITPEGRLTLSSAHNELQAALAGRGLAHLFEEYVRADIDAGRLAEVLADWSPILPNWYLYYPSRRLPSAAMRAFINHVKTYKWPAASVKKQRRA